MLAGDLIDIRRGWNRNDPRRKFPVRNQVDRRWDTMALSSEERLAVEHLQGTELRVWHPPSQGELHIVLGPHAKLISRLESSTLRGLVHLSSNFPVSGTRAIGGSILVISLFSMFNFDNKPAVFANRHDTLSSRSWMSGVRLRGGPTAIVNWIPNSSPTIHWRRERR